MSAYRTPGEKEPEPSKPGFTRIQWVALIALSLNSVFQAVRTAQALGEGRLGYAVFLLGVVAINVGSVFIFARVFRALNGPTT